MSQDNTENERDESVQDDVFDAETANDADHEAINPPVRRPPGRLGGFLALVVGGILAGAIGYGFATTDGTVLPFTGGQKAAAESRERLSEHEEAIEALNVRANATAGQVDALAQELAKLSGLDVIGGRLDSISAELETVLSRLDALDARVADLENRPIPDVGATQDAVAAYERELTAMRDMFAEELERIRQAQEEAVARQQSALETGRNAAQKAALARLRLAVEAGSPLGPAAEELRQSGLQVPNVVSRHADGLPGLEALKGGFPAAARATLDRAVRAAVASGEIGRVEGFLRVQLGIRSLAPRDGGDADAILSRAEAAVERGDISGALVELEALRVSTPALSQWKTDAGNYLEVMSALTALESAQE